jgi:hypothetical protein
VQAGIANTGGTVTSLINAQGAGSSAGTALTYAGILPQEYQVIVDSHIGSPTSYGQLAVDRANNSGNMAVGLSQQYSHFDDATFTRAEQRLVGVLSGVEEGRITIIDNQKNIREFIQQLAHVLR